jgi:hypothetical protein
MRAPRRWDRFSGAKRFPRRTAAHRAPPAWLAGVVIARILARGGERTIGRRFGRFAPATSLASVRVDREGRISRCRHIEGLVDDGLPIPQSTAFAEYVVVGA